MLKSVKDFNVIGKRILVRCDFNVPLDSNGTILDDFRIKKSLPTIEYLIKEEAKIILMSHLDPENQGVVSKNFSLKPIARMLLEFLSRVVTVADDCIGEKVLQGVQALGNGEIMLLENVRFHKEEVNNSPTFAKHLAELGEIYINDAFSACHRAHASMVGVPKILPSGVGLLLQSEIENLSKILHNPVRPMVAIVGGTKVKTKTAFIDRIIKIADVVIVSGFIKKEMMHKLKYRLSKKIIGPAKNLDALDIDEETIEIFIKKILIANTVLWNGPFGKFEDEYYKKGTLAIAKAIKESGAFSVVGGGETIEFLTKEGLLSSFSHVSTGGGAMLAYLGGEKLPGLEALKKYATHS